MDHAHAVAVKTGDVNIFADVTKSACRRETAHGVTTCIRPTHPIYSVKRKRFLTVEELWEQQGLWAKDFPCPRAVKRLIAESPRLAQDLAGRPDVRCEQHMLPPLFNACRKFVLDDDVPSGVDCQLLSLQGMGNTTKSAAGSVSCPLARSSASADREGEN